MTSASRVFITRTTSVTVHLPDVVLITGVQVSLIYQCLYFRNFIVDGIY